MSEANPPQPQPVLVYPQYPIQDDDEINLFELWQQLAARKSLIFKITAFFAVISIIAVLFWPKTWQAEIQFMPPELQNVQGLNVQGLNVQGLNIKKYTPDSIYNEYLDEYQSLTQKRQFFDHNKLLAYYEIELDEDKLKRDIQIEKIFTEFNESLSLNLSKKKERILFIKSTLAFHEQTKSSELLNQYAKMINVHVINRILSEIKSQILLQKTYIKEQINSKKKIARTNRDDRIAVLAEAIKTARLLNIKEGELQFIKGSATKNPINKATSLYYRGYESLEAEQKVLAERKSDVPFIKGIRELEEKAYQLDEQLERIISEKEMFSAVRIDQKALIPDKPIKPKRKLIVIISTIIGFILSLFVVFILNIKH